MNMTPKLFIDGMQMGRWSWPFGLDETGTRLIDSRGRTIIHGWPRAELLKFIHAANREIRRRIRGEMREG